MSDRKKQQQRWRCKDVCSHVSLYCTCCMYVCMRGDGQTILEFSLDSDSYVKIVPTTTFVSQSSITANSGVIKVCCVLLATRLLCTMCSYFFLPFSFSFALFNSSSATVVSYSSTFLLCVPSSSHHRLRSSYRFSHIQYT